MKMSDIIICSDFDDTINNLLPAWTSWLNYVYCLTVSPEDITEWDMQKAYPTLTSKEIYEPLGYKEFWETVTIKPDALEYIPKLIEEGARFYIATATSFHNLCTKVETCMLPNMPFLTKENIISIHHKQLLKCTFLIDDYPANLSGGDYIKILMDAPHNRNSGDIEDFRVFSWKEVYDIIHEYVNAHTISKKQYVLEPGATFRMWVSTYDNGKLIESRKLWEDEIFDYVEELQKQGFERAFTKKTIEKAEREWLSVKSKALMEES